MKKHILAAGAALLALGYRQYRQRCGHALRGALPAPEEREADQVEPRAGVRVLRQPGRQHPELHHGDRHAFRRALRRRRQSAGRLPAARLALGSEVQGRHDVQGRQEQGRHP